MSNTTIHGFLGQDPEVRHFPDGTPVANFSVAETQNWKDKTTGEKRSKTTWFRCVATGNRVKVIADYFKKGSEILITQSEFRTGEYEKDGRTIYTSEFFVTGFEFCGRKSEGAVQRTQHQAQTHAPDNNSPASDYNDEIPF